MKHWIYICFLVLLSACDNMLDVEPENSVTFTNYFESEKDMNALTIQLHSFFRTKLHDTDVASYRGLILDELSNTSMNAQRELNFGEVANVKSRLNSWKFHYDVIYVANVILDNMHRVKDITDARRDFHEGQAYFCKAMAYFDLVRKWGECVIIKNSTEVKVRAKSTVSEVLDYAIECAEEAYKRLPKYEDLKDIAGNPIVQKQYGSKGSTAALLAHAYAWKGSVAELCELDDDIKLCYEKAIEWSSLLLDDTYKAEVGDYRLESTPEEMCVNAFNYPNTSKEVILEFQLDEYATSASTFTPMKYYLAWPVDLLRKENDIQTKTQFRLKLGTIAEMYEAEDKRPDAYFYKFDSLCQARGMDWYAYPYMSREGQYVTNASGTLRFSYLKTNYCYWRVADIYLLRAECYAKLNDDRAIADLNQVRRRANAAAYPSSRDSKGIQDAIFREREKEMLMEGHRYFDVVRNGLPYINNELQGNFSILSLQDVKDGALYMPVSEAAFTLNDLMRQNKFWQQYMK